MGHRISQCPDAKDDSKKDKDDSKKENPKETPKEAPKGDGAKSTGKKVHFTQEEILDLFGFATRVFVTNPESLQSTVLLDNQAQASVFGNLKLLDDLKDLDVPHRFNGIGDTGWVIATQSGSFEGIENVDYAPESGVNVLSWSQLLKQGCKIGYNGERDSFSVGHNFLNKGANSFKVTTPNGIDLHFVASQGLYTLEKDYKVLMTKAEEVQQKIALEIQKRLAYPAISGVSHFIKSGAMINVPIGTKILENMEESIPHIQGKSTRKSNSHSPEIVTAQREGIKSTKIHCDLMFLKPLDGQSSASKSSGEKLSFLISVSDFGLVIIRAIKSKGLPEITKSLSDVIRISST